MKEFTITLNEEQLVLLRYGLAQSKAQAEKSIKAIPDVLSQKANKDAIRKIEMLDSYLMTTARNQMKGGA